MTASKHVYKDENGREVTLHLQQGLVCPEPSELHKLTRTYEQMKVAHDIQNAGLLTAEEIAQMGYAGLIRLF